MGKLATIPGAGLVVQINTAHRNAGISASQAINSAAECGRLLIEAKAIVPHGEWEPWLEAHTEVGSRQAQKYMRLAEHWTEIEAKCEEGSSLLGVDSALRLIAKPKPAPAAADEPADDEPVVVSDEVADQAVVLANALDSIKE